MTNNQAPETPAAQTIEVGDEVRNKLTGKVGIITEINTNPTRVEEEEIWAEFENDDWNSWIDDPEDAELVRKAADIPTKQLPTMVELVGVFSSALHSSFGDEISISETDPRGEPDGQFLAYGTSSTGQRFGCRVTISEIERSDF